MDYGDYLEHDKWCASGFGHGISCNCTSADYISKTPFSNFEIIKTKDGGFLQEDGSIGYTITIKDIAKDISHILSENLKFTPRQQ